jgi:hypothetical protein
MAEPVSYEQILREIKAQRGLKPWDQLAAPAPRAESPQSTGAAQMAAVDPMALAQQRETLMNALSQSFGTMANPETRLAQQGTPPKPGLAQLLMSLMGR